MITRRTALALLATAAAVAVVPGLAAPAWAAAARQRFDRAAFEAALKGDRPVLVDISATWCSTCQRQKQILGDLTGKPAFANYTIFEVDYDTEKDVMRSFGAQQRSTLIAFKRGAETGRVVGDTRVTAIEALLASAA